MSVSRVGPLVLRVQTALSWPGPLFIHQLCLCLRLCGCVGSWGPSPFPHPAVSLLPTYCLSADVARGRCGPWPSGPCACICVSRWPLPSLRRYRWDLRLSVSARAARRRRKQDARGSTVISQRALSHTIPGRSLYSLHAGRHWTFTCANNHTATGPLR